MSDEIMKVVISNLDPVNRHPSVSKTFAGLDQVGSFFYARR